MRKLEILNSLRAPHLAFLLLLLLLPLSATATMSRLQAVGGSQDLLEDEAGLTRWYGALADYPDHLVLESGPFNLADGYWMFPDQRITGPSVGLTRHLDKAGRWGTVGLFYHDLDTDHDLFLENNRLRENRHLLYGHRVGPVDATLSYAHGSWKVDDGTTIRDYSADTYGLGARLDLSATAYLDLALDSRTTTHGGVPADEAGGDENESILNLRSRAFVGLGRSTVLVPVAEWIHEDRIHPFSAADDPRRSDHRLLRLGLGLNHLPDTDHLLLAGVEFENGRRDYAAFRESWRAWLLRTGFENRLSAWLTVRGGLTCVLHDVDSDLPAPVDPWQWLNLDDPILRVNLGASLHLGPADLDLAFGERYPRRAFLGEVFEPQKHWLSASVRWLF